MEDVAEKGAVGHAFEGDCAEALFNGIDELLEVLHTLERSQGYPVLLEFEEVCDMPCVHLRSYATVIDLHVCVHCQELGQHMSLHDG